MKKIILAFIVLSVSVFALDWSKDLNTAFSKARKSHKTVMVFVEGEYCRWCKKLKLRTLSNDKVEKRLAKYVVVKVMREDEKAMKTLPEIEGVPTVFFMTEKKQVLETAVGYWDAMDFISYIDDVEQKVKRLKHK